MVINNGYITLEDAKRSLRITSTDTNDDAVLGTLIESASRYIDRMTTRFFYPLIDTRYYDIPTDYDLWLDYDLLSVTTFTNGDSTVLTTDNYVTQPRNASQTPYWCLSLRDVSSLYWQPGTNATSQGVISVAGVWGYRRRYSTEAWLQVTTLNGSITSSATSITVTSGTAIETGSIMRIGTNTDLSLVTAVSSNTITAQRNYNGGTGAAQNDLTAVYIWQPEADIVQACRLIVDAAYHNRFGNNPTGSVNVTAGGIVITPQDVPTMAVNTISTLERLA